MIYAEVQKEVVLGLVGADLMAWFESQIREFWEGASDDDDYLNADNFRFALVGDAHSEGLYDDAVSDGCCGACDVMFPHPNGQHVFKYGFNYGH